MRGSPFDTHGLPEGAFPGAGAPLLCRRGLRSEVMLYTRIVRRRPGSFRSAFAIAIIIVPLLQFQKKVLILLSHLSKLGFVLLGTVRAHAVELKCHRGNVMGSTEGRSVLRLNSFVCAADEISFIELGSSERGGLGFDETRRKAEAVNVVRPP